MTQVKMHTVVWQPVALTLSAIFRSESAPKRIHNFHAAAL